MRSRAARGFTLLELVVSLFVVSLVLMLAMQLLNEVQLTFLEWRRTIPDPQPQLAVQLLRSDIQRSRRLLSPFAGNRLGLELPDGSRIDYERNFDRLYRSITDPDGEELGRRAVFRGIQLWNWQEISPRLVQVEIAFHRQQDPGRRHLGGLGRLRNPGPVTETVRMRFALRADPGRRSW